MGTTDNIAAQQAFGEAVNSGDFAAFDDLVAADVVDHDPAPQQQPGPDGYRSLFSELRAAFPDMHLAVDHLTAVGDDVAFAYTLTGTHQGPLNGHEPTGKSINIHGLQISRFQNGKMVERWGSSDQLGMLAQLGLVTP